LDHDLSGGHEIFIEVFELFDLLGLLVIWEIGRSGFEQSFLIFFHSYIEYNKLQR